MSSRARLRTSELITSMGLINRALERDPHAWERMVYLYTPLIEYWARKRGVTDVENVRQEVFTSLLRALVNFEKRQNGSFRGWIRTITENLINKIQGKKVPITLAAEPAEWLFDFENPRSTLGQMFDSTSESSSIEDRILFRRIMDWVRENYTDTQTDILIKLVIDQRTPSDIAKDFGVSVNVVYQTKSRILANIRREFHELV